MPLDRMQAGELAAIPLGLGLMTAAVLVPGLAPLAVVTWACYWLAFPPVWERVCRWGEAIGWLFTRSAFRRAGRRAIRAEMNAKYSALAPDADMIGTRPGCWHNFATCEWWFYNRRGQRVAVITDDAYARAGVRLREQSGRYL
jgi:hypothetical protein